MIWNYTTESVSEERGIFLRSPIKSQLSSKKKNANFTSPKHKLSSDTTNLPSRDGFTKIQIFEIILKEPDLAPEVICVIDKVFAYINLPPRNGETLESLVERVRLTRKYRRELQALEVKMKSEKQFNRKVELNAQVREHQARFQELQ